MTIETLAANMRRAFIDRKGATIGGGRFTPEELKEGAAALAEHSILLAAIKEIAQTKMPDNNDD